MKFDFAIGNPPYQEEASGASTSDKPIYNVFMEAAYSVADRVELISPARFLFNAGATPSAWNKKMLSDKHLKVQMYEGDSQKVFPSVLIPGGIAGQSQILCKRQISVQNRAKFHAGGSGLSGAALLTT